MTIEQSYKQAAIEQWTADPCGSTEVDRLPGSREYFEDLLSMRHNYAPWMADALDYEGSAGLDILDVGCGQGIDMAHYAMAGAVVTGVDLTPRHVELARAHLETMGLHGTVVQGDAEDLPFADHSFDVVSSNGVLHHTPNLPSALAEIRRVLRPGGDTTIIVYNRASLYYWVSQVLWNGVLAGQLLTERSMEGVMSRGVEESRSGARPLVRVYGARQTRQLLSEAGFSSVEVTIRHFHPSDTFVTQIIAKRWAFMRRPDVLEWIGRRAGWYLVATAKRQRH